MLFGSCSVYVNLFCFEFFFIQPDLIKINGRKLGSVDDLYNWLESAYSYLAMVNYPYPANFMMPLPGDPIKEVSLSIQ